MTELESLTDIALSKFSEGYNCAQSVLYAFGERAGLDKDVALRIATGFGVGIGRKQEVCGAVSGGVMVLGLLRGRREGEGRENTERTYALCLALLDEIAERHGSYLCRDLVQGCDLRTAEGKAKFTEARMLDTVCAPCVRSVVEAVYALVEGEGS